MATPIPLVLALSRETLRLNQLGLAKLLGSSLRTVQRWEARRGTPSFSELQRLADAVRPHDPDLASQIDVWAPRPAPPAPPVLPPAPVAIAAPAVLPPPGPPPTPPVPRAVLVDSVVCAAAEAMALSPQAVRPAVLAAFARATEAGLTPEAVVGVLAPPPPPPAPEETPAKGKAPRTKSAST